VRKIIVPLFVVNQILIELLCKSVDDCAKFPLAGPSLAGRAMGAADAEFACAGLECGCPSSIFEGGVLNFLATLAQTPFSFIVRQPLMRSLR
jgi:hypothetical protein